MLATNYYSHMQILTRKCFINKSMCFKGKINVIISNMAEITYFISLFNASPTSTAQHLFKNNYTI